MKIQTPYYLIDENKILENMKIIEKIRSISGAKFLLALKCFSTWSVFKLMSEYMDGVTCSSLNETKLGFEEFGKEVQTYCVAFSDDDINEISDYSKKLIFNSFSQLNRYKDKIKKLQIGIRINPNFSYSHFDLADPAREFSRLGVVNKDEIVNNLDLIDGVMFHYNCENDDFSEFSNLLDRICENYDEVLRRIKWVSLGGGIHFTGKNYPIEKFGEKLKTFQEKYNIQLFLEPGEASITNSGFLVTKVLDIVKNEKDIAIVDASIEAHMLDLLTYNEEAKIEEKYLGENEYMIAGRSCLAGDVFGEYKLKNKLKIGDKIIFSNAAGYTMVKKNWFNGVDMPSIAIKRLDGKIELIREFKYKDFKESLS